MTDLRSETRLDAPDLVVFGAVGEVNAAEANEIGRLLREHSRNDVAFLLTKIRGGSLVLPGKVRRIFVEQTRGISVIVDAVVGADFHVRVLGRLVAGAARMLSGTTLRLGFFDDEHAARTWLKEQGCIACGAVAEGS